MSQISSQVSVDNLNGIQLEPLGYPSPLLSQKHLQRPSTPPLHINTSTESLTPPSSIPSKWRAGVIIGTIAGITIVNSMLAGILIVALPTMAREIGLSGNLLLWPAGVNALACGCTLLLSGSISDVIGGRKIYLLGEVMLIATTIACGTCRTGIQLILFRAAQGVAMSLCLPSSVSLITANIPTGTFRNTAFACLGAGQPLGFSIGLVLGGVFVDSIGWRYGYYIGAILTFIVFIVSIFGIPAEQDVKQQSFAQIIDRIKTEIDWLGCTILSTSLGMFSYVFSVLAGGSARFLEPASLALFSIAVLLLPAFIFHILRQERLGKKVIIPPSLLRNRVFTSLCVTVFVVWGVFNAVQYFLTLFFQSVQQLSAIQTSLRFLPMVVTGSATNFITGYAVKRVRADILVLTSAALTAISPLLMAITQPGWSYWTTAFFAVALTPICADVLFTVANLLITSVFPEKSHGLAGGIFNTIANIGCSIGLAVTAVVASSVTLREMEGKGAVENKQELLDGYRAAFWLAFGVGLSVCVVVGWGLRKIGKVGVKIE
jgi:MFS family permease